MTACVLPSLVILGLVVEAVERLTGVEAVERLTGVEAVGSEVDTSSVAMLSVEDVVSVVLRGKLVVVRPMRRTHFEAQCFHLLFSPKR